MNGSTTTFRSILEKPLNQLTEDDISQLTREDCRKYLKEKGMRRPSWNKSQAIQQVISLKALLEPNDDSGAGALRKIVVSPHTTTTPQAASDSADSGKEASADAHVSVSADEPVLPNQRPVYEGRSANVDTKAISPRNQCTTDASVRQMTIFYSGNVNVYDGVPPDKARAIMHLAASPNHLPLDNQFGGTASVMSLRWQFQTAGDKDGLFPPSATISQAMQTEKTGEYTQQYWEKGNGTRNPEGQASRKVLLQRYLEKRKDRNQCTTDASVRQMTIFYSGNVNVYDGVPPDKARAIMHLAASPNHFPLDNQFGGTASVMSLRWQFQTAGDKDGLIPPSATISQAMQTEKTGEYTQQYWEKGNSTRNPEGQASRKVLLQRYREKRKDRGRLKIKKNIGSSSSLEVYVNHQHRTHTLNGNSSQGGTSSPSQPGRLQTPDNQPKIRCLPVDLNEKDIRDRQT